MAARHPPDAIFSWKMISLGSSSQSLSAAPVVACCSRAQHDGADGENTSAAMAAPCTASNALPRLAAAQQHANSFALHRPA